MAALLLLLFGFFGYRLYSLQVLQYQRFHGLARRNYVRSVREPALRGRIYDLKGRPLADNVARFDLTLSNRHQTRRETEAVFEALGEILGKPTEELREEWRRAPRDRNGARTVATDIDYGAVVSVGERASILPGVEVVERPRRWTVFGDVGAHVLGYTGEISSEELRRTEFAGYQMGEEVGRAGIERMMEGILHGKAGERKIRVYANGLIEDKIPGEGVQAEPGKDVVLSIDWRLQAAAQGILGASPGAVVVMDPWSGDILAMASSPTYDPNAFAVPSAERAEILTTQVEGLSRLVNLSLEVYAPGSVFKVPLALAALDSGRLLPGFRYECTGLYYLPNWTRPWRCWTYAVRRGGHGEMDVVDALQHSCDCFFYQLGKQLGVDFLDRAAAGFGFGELTGILLPSEKAGFRPSAESKREAVRRFGGGDPTWYPGDTIHGSIGQGIVMASPLQVSCMMAMVANGGTLWEPRLVREVRTRDGLVVEERPSQVRARVEFGRRALETVRQGLYRVVNEPGGTAYQHRLAGASVCGKTATAQNEDAERDHAWFTCYAPREKPEVVVTVLVLWAGHGGSVAAPKAMEILEGYFSDLAAEPVSIPRPSAPLASAGL